LGQLSTIFRTNFFGVGPQPDIATSTFSYDAGNRLTQIAYTDNGGTAIDAYSWTYDAANRVASMTTTTDGTATYSYDNTNQVAGASYTGTGQPSNESYSYDSNGNRTNTGYSTGTNNQLASDGTFNYTYDAEGNRISRTRISSASANDYLTTYTWDYRDRLTDVDFYNNSSVLTSHVHYTYDVYDHRISKSLDRTGSGTYNRIEDYVYDGDHVVLDFLDPDGAGPSSLALATRYLNGPGNAGAADQVFAQEDADSGAVLWLLADNLGTTRDIVDNTSALLAHFVYNSFGELASGPTNLTRFLYTGEEWDADSGLQYNWHRWYDSFDGRWTSQDPNGFAARDANVGRYVGNSSTNGTDPLGLEDAPADGGSSQG
jgi:RHS repeat-associated protein